MKRMRVWTHYDTGIEVVVNAKDDRDALEKAEFATSMMDDKKFNKQIADNLQAGDMDIIETTETVAGDHRLWTKKLDDMHIVSPEGSTTLCGKPMLGNNYADVFPERTICKECFKQANKAINKRIENKTGKKHLNELDDSEDVMLMMQFRQERWDEWEKFCHEQGYKSKVKQ
jgi:hypothetical protein